MRQRPDDVLTDCQRVEYRRDPSVVMWSIGNEVRDLGDQEQGPAIAGRCDDRGMVKNVTRAT